MTTPDSAGYGTPDTRLKIGGPDAISLVVCHSCERTDRWNKMTERHYRRPGGWCPGPVERVAYVRVTSHGGGA